MNRLIIGFCGQPGAGKSTAAAALVELGFEPFSVADPIKRMLDVIVPDIANRKDELIPHLGVTGRELIQTLAYEWGRVMVHSDIWLHPMFGAIDDPMTGDAVIDDVRFGNTVDAIHKRGGIVIRIVKPQSVIEKMRQLFGHRCEVGRIKADFELTNSGTVAELVSHVLALVCDHSHP